jgi:hypothetical protein
MPVADQVRDDATIGPARMILNSNGFQVKPLMTKHKYASLGQLRHRLSGNGYPYH